MDGAFENPRNIPISNQMPQPAQGDIAVPASSNTQPQKLGGRIASWSILLLFSLLPFFFIPTAWASIAQAKMFLIGILVILATLSWIAAAFSEGAVRVPKSPLLLAALLVPVAYFVSAFATGASWASFVGGGTQQDTVVTVLIWYALLVACANVLSGSTSKLVSVMKALVAGGAVMLLIQILHLVIPSFTFGGSIAGQAASVIGSWHDLGIFLGLLFFLALALLSTSVAQSRLWKSVLIAVALVSAAFLLIVNFRDVWVATTILSIAYAGFLWYVSRGTDETIRRTFLKRALLWAVISLAFFGLYFGGNTIHNILPSSLQVTQVEVRPSWQGTYTVGSRVFTQPGRVFFGSGPNTFPREWVLHKPLSVNATQFWNFDFYSGVGFIPTSFVTVGLLGAVAWGAVFLALLVSAWVVIRARRNDGMRILHAVLVGSAVYLTAFHILYVPGPALSALLFMLFGAVVAVELSTNSTRSWTLPLSLEAWKAIIWVGVLTIFGLVVLFAGVQSVRALVSDMFVNRAAVVYNDTQDIASASRQIATALVISSQNDRAHRAAVELGLLQFAELAAANDSSEEASEQLQNTLTATIQHGLEAVAIGSTNYQNWILLASLYGELAGVGVEGAATQARVAYREARNSNPTNPLPSLGLAQLDLAAADDDSARGHLVTALGIKPDLAAAIYLLSQVEARAGNLEAARARAEDVVRVAPDDALGWYNLGTMYYADVDYVNATLAFERAVGIQNDYANALFLLSASYAGLDRLDDALIALKAVDALDPSQESVQDMITQFENGENPFAPTP